MLAPTKQAKRARSPAAPVTAYMPLPYTTYQAKSLLPQQPLSPFVAFSYLVDKNV